MSPVTARGRAIRPLNELTATEIVAAIGASRASCEAVVRACLDRIAAREADVQAFAHIDPDAAISAARRFGREGRCGPLAGVPLVPWLPLVDHEARNVADQAGPKVVTVDGIVRPSVAASGVSARLRRAWIA